jgi:integrase
VLRHACGFALANAGHDTSALQAYLGHRNIQHTVAILRQTGLRIFGESAFLPRRNMIATLAEEEVIDMARPEMLNSP